MFYEFDVYTIQLYLVICGRLVSFACTPVALFQIKLTGISSTFLISSSKQVTTLQHINIWFSLTVGRTENTVLRLFFYIGIVLFCIRISSILEMSFSIGYSHWFCVRRYCTSYTGEQRT